MKKSLKLVFLFIILLLVQNIFSKNVLDAKLKMRNPKKIPLMINSSEYEYDLDREILIRLRKIKFLNRTVRKYRKQYVDNILSVRDKIENVRCTPNQFKNIWLIGKNCSEILDLEEPEIWITNDPYTNAFTYYVEDKDSRNNSRPFIIITRRLVEISTSDEMYFIIGHELGHIKSNHTMYTWLSHKLIRNKHIIFETLYGSLLNFWSRQAEITCDRAGLICCQDTDAACSILGKLMTGLPNKINVQEIERQFDELNDQGVVPRSLQKIIEFTQNHPHTPNRLIMIKKFSKSKTYRTIISE